MLKGKGLLDYTNLFSPNEYKNNDKMILKCLQYNPNKLKCIIMFAVNIENLKKLKYHIFLEKHEVFIFFTPSVIMNMKKYLKKSNQLKC